MSPLKETWFVLFGGESGDGRGYPEYKGRTTSAKQALQFYLNEIKKLGSYAIGKVILYTDKEEITMSEQTLRNLTRTSVQRNTLSI